jgi:hypothetical protein
MLTSRDEQLRRSAAWLEYVRRRTIVSNMTDGTWEIGPWVNAKDPKEILKTHRRRMGEIVKLYPDFPARADRQKIPGYDTHNPKRTT